MMLLTGAGDPPTVAYSYVNIISTAVGTVKRNLSVGSSLSLTETIIKQLVPATTKSVSATVALTQTVRLIKTLKRTIPQALTLVSAPVASPTLHFMNHNVSLDLPLDVPVQFDITGTGGDGDSTGFQYGGNGGDFARATVTGVSPVHIWATGFTGIAVTHENDEDIIALACSGNSGTGGVNGGDTRGDIIHKGGRGGDLGGGGQAATVDADGVEGVGGEGGAGGGTGPGSGGAAQVDGNFPGGGGGCSSMETPNSQGHGAAGVVIVTY